MVAKPNEACLYTMTIPMYLVWNEFPTCKLQRVITQQIFLIRCGHPSPTQFLTIELIIHQPEQNY